MKNFRQIIVELVVLAFVVSLTSSLLFSALEDLLGVCPYSAQICHQIELEGAIKAVLFLVCSVAAVVLSFILSKDFHDNGDD